MEKVVIDSKIKFVKDDIEDVVDKGQYVSEVIADTGVITTTISAGYSYTFAQHSGLGFKFLKIISDVPITMSYTSQANTYDFGVNFKEIQLVANGERGDVSADWIASYGSITITNTSATNVANVKIIFTY